MQCSGQEMPVPSEWRWPVVRSLLDCMRAGDVWQRPSNICVTDEVDDGGCFGCGRPRVLRERIGKGLGDEGDVAWTC